MSETSAVVAYIKQDAINKRINQLLGSRAPQFITSLTSAVNDDEKLAKCEPRSVLTAALKSAALNLPIDQNLGFAYLIPYKKNGNKKNTDEEDAGEEIEVIKCQFQMGYKGYIQLLQRSGQAETVNATDVRRGEIKNQNRLTGAIDFEWIEDEEERQKAEVVGYAAYLKLTNGFEKIQYMTVGSLENHATKYSKSYARYKSGLWATSFDEMAKKTVIKLLISKYGSLSTELQEAIRYDQQIDDEYADNPKTVIHLNEEQSEEIKNEAAEVAAEIVNEEAK